MRLAWQFVFAMQVHSRNGRAVGDSTALQRVEKVPDVAI